MAESDSFKVIKALMDGANNFLNSISSLETAIVNALSCNNVADNRQTPKPKTSNLENSICNFIASIWGLNTKVEGGADIIAKWKRNNLKRDFPNKNDDEIKVLVEKTRQKAINLYRKISDDSETQQEIKLISLLHAHRLKLIKEVLKEDSKSEEDKLKEIKDILENKGNFNPNFNLMNNIYWLTEVNFHPGDDLELRSFLPKESTPAKAPTNSSSIYPPQRRDPSQDRIILDKETKEQLLFRLNDFGYSCLGVLESDAEKSHKIEALKTLCQKESTTDYAKEYSATKKNIQSKIEKGARFVEEELGRIKFEANILANQAKETPDIRQKTISSLLDDQIETIKSKVAKKIKEDKFIGPESEDQLALESNPRVILPELDHINQPQKQSALKESQKQIKVVKQFAENIAIRGILEGKNTMLDKLTSFQVVGAIRTAMYHQAFIEISFAKGVELVETVRKMTGGDVTPKSSPKIQPRAQHKEPPIEAPRRPQKSK
jgi:hypothetical protein